MSADERDAGAESSESPESSLPYVLPPRYPDAGPAPVWGPREAELYANWSQKFKSPEEKENFEASRPKLDEFDNEQVLSGEWLRYYLDSDDDDYHAKSKHHRMKVERDARRPTRETNPLGLMHTGGLVPKFLSELPSILPGPESVDYSKKLTLLAIYWEYERKHLKHLHLLYWAIKSDDDRPKLQDMVFDHENTNILDWHRDLEAVIVQQCVREFLTLTAWCELFYRNKAVMTWFGQLEHPEKWRIASGIVECKLRAKTPTKAVNPREWSHKKYHKHELPETVAEYMECAELRQEEDKNNKWKNIYDYPQLDFFSVKDEMLEEYERLCASRTTPAKTKPKP